MTNLGLACTFLRLPVDASISSVVDCFEWVLKTSAGRCLYCQARYYCDDWDFGQCVAVVGMVAHIDLSDGDWSHCCLNKCYCLLGFIID